jgi:hypothetical protein
MAASHTIVVRVLTAAALLAAAVAESAVTVVPHESESRIEVRVDGRAFTEYLYRPGSKKPILFPLRTDRDTVVTRGFPLAPRPGERVDHPHHTGLWLNYGSVNGVDFWNASEASPRAAQMGTIVHTAVRKAEGGKKSGLLEVEAEWVMPNGTAALREETRFVFHEARRTRIVDRTTRLVAKDERVVLADHKEGLLGLRVARFLEHRDPKPVERTGADGRPAAAVADDDTVTGQYRTSEGRTGDAVWGTRGRWAALTGRNDGETVTVAILDHPKNPGFPTYWHARGYGLFSANPLGQKVFSEGKEELNLTLAPGEAATFRYRILIISKAASDSDLEKAYQRFAREAE